MLITNGKEVLSPAQMDVKKTETRRKNRFSTYAVFRLCHAKAKNVVSRTLFWESKTCFHQNICETSM